LLRAKRNTRRSRRGGNVEANKHHCIGPGEDEANPEQRKKKRPVEQWPPLAPDEGDEEVGEAETEMYQPHHQCRLLHRG